MPSPSSARSWASRRSRPTCTCPPCPRMGRALGADAGTVELTVSGYLVGFSLGQLLWGPIGDRHGRRFPVAIGLVLFAVGSAGCALAGSAWAMVGWRVVQAVGACAGVGLARAMVRDLCEGARAARVDRKSTRLNSRHANIS